MTSASEIIAALGGDAATGMCPCPCHDDGTPSLHVSEGERRPVFYCHGGCSQEVVLATLRERGLWQSPAFVSHQRARHRSEADDEAQGTWDTARRLWRAHAMSKEKPKKYLRARGIKLAPEALALIQPNEAARLGLRRFPTVIAPVVSSAGRLIGTQVTALTMDGKQKVSSHRGNERMSYGSIKGGYVQLAEIKPDAPLIIGEGVETVLSAMELSGFAGIAALGTANLTALKPPRAGECIIAADNDDAGRRAAAGLAERLRYEGRRVRIAVPATEGDDWNDVLLAGGTEEEWQAALDADDGEESAGPISALEEDKFMALAFPKRELLLEPWLPRPGLAMVYAPKGEGKTWFALAVAKAVAAGDDLLNWRCPTYGRVLYVEGELPGQSVQDRLSKFRRSPPGMFHVLSRDTFLLRREAMPDLGEAVGRQELDRIIKQCRPDVIIIDTISTMVRSGVENDAESWAPIQTWLLKHRWEGRTVIVIHHSGKSGQQRGTSKREDVMDTIIKLKKQTDECTDTQSVFDLTFEKSRDFFGRDAEPMRLRFSIDDGQAEWRAEPMRDVRLEKIREMLDAGMKQKEISRELGLTAGRVSQIVRDIKGQEAGGKVVKFPDRRDRDEV